METFCLVVFVNMKVFCCIRLKCYPQEDYICTVMLDFMINRHSLAKAVLYNYDVCLVPSQRRAYLQQAMQLIRSCVDKTDSSTDGSKAVSVDNVILCTEVACQVHVFFVCNYHFFVLIAF